MPGVRRATWNSYHVLATGKRRAARWPDSQATERTENIEHACARTRVRTRSVPVSANAPLVEQWERKYGRG